MPLLESTRRGGTTTLTVDSPANRNALSAAVAGRLRDELTACMDDGGTHVVVITATGTTFCSGADLSEIRDSGGASVVGADLAGLLEVLMEAPKPTVARVNGHVRGGGLGIVAACDVAIAPAAATFAFPEVLLGVAPAMIAPAVLARLEPRAASRYLLTGETFAAEEAARIGLLTAAPADIAGVDALVGDVVTALGMGDPAAQAATKELLADRGLRGAVDRLGDMRRRSQALFSSSEAQRRIAAVLDQS